MASQTKASMVARRVTRAQLVECGDRLRRGDLVAFPTETVYGLGCHALDPSAVQKVFEAKERPLTDPLIVHVAQTQDALKLWVPHDESIRILQILCDEFWPGPLTLVAPAAPQVPSIIMADTGFVACRCPMHPLAQSLLQEARVPIAAPSANKFGHVSPTQADHVLDDLGQENVWVLEDTERTSPEEAACQIGVESTVAKLEINTKEKTNSQLLQQRYTLTVLRQGAISIKQMATCLEKAGRSDVDVTGLSCRMVEETEATVAPGQSIKHYSPRIPSFLLGPDLITEVDCANQDKGEDEWNHLLQQSIILDFGGRLAAWKSTAKQYRDLSPSSDSSQAAQCVFEALRWAERIDESATYIIFPQVASNFHDSCQDYDALTLALNDRLTRAASGVVLDSLVSVQNLLVGRE